MKKLLVLLLSIFFLSSNINASCSAGLKSLTTKYGTQCVVDPNSSIRYTGGNKKESKSSTFTSVTGVSKTQYEATKEEKKDAKYYEAIRNAQIKKERDEVKRRADAKTAELQKKAAEAKRIADAKKAEAKRIADAKKAEAKRIAQEKLNMQLSLIPPKTELQNAQTFLNDVQVFVKNNPGSFDILEVTEFMQQSIPILDGSFKAKDRKNIEAFKRFTEASYAFRLFRQKQLELETQNEVKKIDKLMKTLSANIEYLGNYRNNNSLFSSLTKPSIQSSQSILDNPQTLSELINAIKSTSLLMDEISSANNQMKIANKQIAILTVYLQENMLSDLAPKVMFNLKKLKNASQNETLKEKVTRKESPSKYLGEVNREVNLFISKNNIPQMKEESKVITYPEVVTYPVSNSSYSTLNYQVGCKSDYSAEKGRDIFNSNYKNHWMKWRGRIIIVSSNSVSLDTEEPKFDFFKTDLRVSFEESGAGYHLKEGQTITVRFLMKSAGGCYYPFEGERATIVN